MWLLLHRIVFILCFYIFLHIGQLFSSKFDAYILHLKYLYVCGRGLGGYRKTGETEYVWVWKQKNCCISYVCISYLSARFTLAEGVWNDKFLAAALCLVRQCKLDTKMFTHSLVFPFFSNDTNVIALESRVKLSIMSLCSELFSVFCVCVCCLFFAGACDSAY